MAWVKFFKKPAGNLGKSYQPGSMLSLAPTKGLLNEPGQNSCFLNSAVQVLWQLDIFRRSLRQLSGHFCLGGTCIFCSLKSIFTQFQNSRDRALPSDNLRLALAETFKDEQRFQLGFMDDAAECFENILERIHMHIAPDSDSDGCTSKSCITHQKFAMTLYEQAVCRSCGASSDPLPFTELVHYVSTTSLCQQLDRGLDKSDRPRSDRFGELLYAVCAVGDLRNCPSECGQRIPTRRVLMNSPDIVTIGFVWDAEQSDLTEDVIRSLGPFINLSELFYGVMDEQAKKSELRLVGMICYTSRHYCAFAYHTKTSKWVFFDDATVKEVGSKWKDVTTKCIRGHFQPLLLFYSNPDGSAVSPDDAPKPTNMGSHYKPAVNGEAPVPETVAAVAKRTENDVVPELKHPRVQTPGPSRTPFIRGSGQTSGGRGPVRILHIDPRSKLKELSRECAQRVGEVRGTLARRDPERNQRTQRHRVLTERTSRDVNPDKMYSRSASPPESGFQQYAEQRLYNSQGKGPSRGQRTPVLPRAAQEAFSPSRVQVLPSVQGRRFDLTNGYDTDSSQESRERAGRSRPRAWRPMRETLNVDSVLSSQDQERQQQQRQQGNRRRPPGQERAQYDRERAWARDDRRPKNLMTIYEDEQKNEMGSHSSLESEDRGTVDKERTKAGLNLAVRNDTWKMQRAESGYESSDRISNGSTNPDSPGVENFAAKELKPIPEMRDRPHPGRYDDPKPDLPLGQSSHGEYPGRAHNLPESHNLRSPSILQRRKAFRGAGSVDGMDGDEKVTNVNGWGHQQRSPVPPGLAKGSSSEWNSSDDLLDASETEDNCSRCSSGNVTPASPPWESHQPIYQNLLPLLPPKTFPQIADGSRTTPQVRQPQELTQPSSRVGFPVRSPTPCLPPPNHAAKQAPSSDIRSRLEPSNLDRGKLLAREGERKGPDGSADKVLPTSSFLVDGCMTDSYRQKYYHQMALQGNQKCSSRRELQDTNHPVSLEFHSNSSVSNQHQETWPSLSQWL
uniref:Ubiquitin specific peptidase 53 n=1 Tax=Paramormyrops kingsleyae TaxID=1676925 RepID=A0A3B3RNM2_9TELE|nr:inactive ubiquitin carboxyl-terminal hydrolase 53-like [Paramormyrops kingsleyae]XP_023650066.1 inactive ubiquitin carboxyl-terminal hydrolase 53-like [Paramormyrops kingsleyae]XP_023650067.1 inactive ubiquitin carboxyl-terminal hydrolase 53-like [Paramormyrops kingsleyae]XP_023650068.1 inactive ubiquitin carboxyl-terminal hydrolase 53-like [Paramormyrops kingsleyae]XP_023650069.1 inactive ubiquitin carboxyl-terminal hydrolase 53-like [Paramormyrops kingsleyae]